MKVKNIMFSGVMASILMMGGAYAAGNANNDLATAGFVRGAYNAAVETALTNVSADDDTVTLTKDVTEKGDAATIKIKVNASKFDAAGAATSAAAGALSDAKTYADGKVKDLADGAVATNTAAIASINNTTTGILAQAKGYADGLDAAMDSRVDALEAATGSVTDIAGAIANAVAAEAEIARAAEQANAADIDSLESRKVDKVTGSSLVADTKVAAYDAHIANADIHVTAEQKEAWTGKQDALNTAQLAAVNSGITSAKVGTYDGYAATIAANTSAISAEETRAKGVEGDKAALTTDAKGTLVAAINEVDANANAAQLAAEAAQTTANAAATKTYVDTELGKKQNTLTAGTNITIADNGTISAIDTNTTYTAGDGILIDPATGNAISAAVDGTSIKIDTTSKKIKLGFDVTNGTFSK